MDFLSQLKAAMAIVVALVTVSSFASAAQDKDAPVMAGYDLVAYHSLDPSDDGVSGSPLFQSRHNGFLYYFSTEENKLAFEDNPTFYLPKYGGFCAWGIAWEYPDQGWPWAAHHMGPPCGPRDGWALIPDPITGEKQLYCSIWRSYQDDFNQRQNEGIRRADERWIQFYGSREGGPMNNGCYSWNWHECFAKSIYNPSGTATTPNNEATSTLAPTPSSSLYSQQDALETVWSSEQPVMGGSVMWKWTLQDVTTTQPLLVVELNYALNYDDEFGTDTQYLGFGVAEQLMQGALVACAPQLDGSSTCNTYMGAGMGVRAVPTNTDPVQPTVLFSEKNGTHYNVRFAANLFGGWANPHWPARVLFSRGLVSGNGDPMPHRNHPLHRQAITGVEFLSVVKGTDTNVTDAPPATLALTPLPQSIVSPQSIPSTIGSVDILQGRVRIQYELLHYGPDQQEVVKIELQNIAFIHEDEYAEESYVGFGFAQNTMSGLVVTCSPRVVLNSDNSVPASKAGVPEVTAVCHQWRGFGTNLYPLDVAVDAGGWFLDGVSYNGTHLNYTLLGRTSQVIQALGAGGARVYASLTNMRAICALGRAAPETGTPLMHTSQDRTPMVLGQLSTGQPGYTVVGSSFRNGKPSSSSKDKTAQTSSGKSSAHASASLFD